MTVKAMPNEITYSKSPIQEALIDVKVSYGAEFNLNSVESLHDEFREDLPQKTARNSVVFSINPEEGSSVNNSEVDGFMFRAGDGSRVLQITKEGFTFSLINTYSGWEEFFGEAMRYWEIFLNKLAPISINRLGIRYVNKINIPKETDNLSDYFTTQASLGGITNKPTELFLRAVIPHDKNICIVTEATNQTLVVGDEQGFILDIDVFNEEPFNASEKQKLTEQLEELRAVKNDVFQKSLTSKTKDMFK